MEIAGLVRSSLCNTFPMAHLSLSSLSSASYSPSCPLIHRRIFAVASRIQASSSSSSISNSNSTPKVVVTRERGKNGKLISSLVCVSLRLRHFRFEIFLRCWNLAVPIHRCVLFDF
ncbi:unnamed protein product [Prunus brigantina]